MLFQDRPSAGKQLAARLAFLRDTPNVLVLGIPRGGVVVAAEIAHALTAPLDVFLAHKLGAPFNPELAMGALTSAGEIVLDDALIDELDIRPDALAREIEFQRAEIARRARAYRGERRPLALENKIVVVVDDGIATGLTMLATLRAIRHMQPARVILATPVAARDALERLTRECDQIVVLAMPEPFWAVGRYYARFDQTGDAQVIALLAAARDCAAG